MPQLPFPAVSRKLVGQVLTEVEGERLEQVGDEALLSRFEPSEQKVVQGRERGGS